MKRRPTIPDLADAAGVSVSTVNRVINQPESVRQKTRELVLSVAQHIGFYGLGSIEHSVRLGRDTYRLGVLLHQPGRTFYANLGQSLSRAANAFDAAEIDLEVRHLDDLSPDNVASHLREMGKSCDSVALVAAQHPIVADAIDAVLLEGVPVTALIAPLSARGGVGFVGLDSWKVGRTAAWTFDRIIRDPGKIGILLGNHRYRNQEMNESGFRSYFREHNDRFTLLEPQQTFESAAAARSLTEEMFSQHPDMCGLFISGGGITGALSALRDCAHRRDFVAVGYELFDLTRDGLVDGTLTLVISHPMETLARETISAMVKAKSSGTELGAPNVTIDFEIFTSENV